MRPIEEMDEFPEQCPYCRAYILEADGVCSDCYDEAVGKPCKAKRCKNPTFENHQYCERCLAESDEHHSFKRKGYI